MKGPATPPLHQARLRQIAKLSSTELGFRIVVAVVILASVSFALWNFFKVMPPLQKRSRELASTAARLSSEVDDLDRKWRREQVVEITAKYGQLHDQLFGDAAAFQSWLANLNEQAAPLALDAKADFGKTTPVAAPGEKLAIIPATITAHLRHNPGAQRPLTPYHRPLPSARSPRRYLPRA